MLTEVIGELRRRSVIRSKNVTGDYAEFLSARALKLELAPNSTPGFDGTDKSGFTYQVKGRQWTDSNNSRQLGVIRHIKGFDQLVAIVFRPDWTVEAAAVIPPYIVKKYATKSAHQNGYILHARENIMKHKKVRNITRQVRAAQKRKT